MWGSVVTAARPNFFILGAPRSGTQALRRYLGEHPRIAVSKSHEFCFFCEVPASEWSAERTREHAWEYSHVRPEHLAVGETSTISLFSEVAAANIKAFLPSARILVMIRNYTDYLNSVYERWRLLGYEDAPSFERAWRLQDARSRGESIPKACLMPMLLQYREIGRLGHCAERILNVFPPSQVKLIFFEDFSTRTRTVYEEVLSFLGVPSDGRTDFPRVNASIIARHPTLTHLLATPMLPARAWPWVDRARVTAGMGRGMRGKILARMGRHASPSPLSPGFARELRETFREDASLLSKLSGRDLGHWVSRNAT